MLTHLLLLFPTLSGDVLLPEGPAARAWAGVDTASPISDEWQEGLGEGAAQILSETDPWQHPTGWHCWRRWLSSDERTPAESAALSIFAARGGRSEDAWKHYARLVADPAAAAAVMPRLLPGISPGSTPGMSLPEGSLLRPTPPPGALAAARGQIRPVTASSEFTVGEATVRLVISIEPSGVEVTLYHLAGGPAALLIQLPELLERDVRVSYIDWMRQDAQNDPLAVELSAETGAPVQLFGRFQARREPMPTPPKGSLPVQLTEAGLWIVPEGDEDPTPLHLAAAAAIAGSLGVPGGVRSTSAGTEGSPSAGTVVRLSRGPEGQRTLARIAGATEAWVREHQ